MVICQETHPFLRQKVSVGLYEVADFQVLVVVFLYQLHERLVEIQTDHGRFPSLEPKRHWPVAYASALRISARLVSSDMKP